MNRQNSLQVDASIRLYVAMWARLHIGSLLEAFGRSGDVVRNSEVHQCKAARNRLPPGVVTV